jgi:hypothetical protein
MEDGADSGRTVTDHDGCGGASAAEALFYFA